MYYSIYTNMVKMGIKTEGVELRPSHITIGKRVGTQSHHLCFFPCLLLLLLADLDPSILGVPS